VGTADTGSRPTSVRRATPASANGRSSLAAFFSFLLPGLGQAYNGQSFLAWLFIVPMVMLGAVLAAAILLAGSGVLSRLVDTRFLAGLIVLDAALLGWRLVAILQAHGHREAASARRWHLPVPAAVDAVFPAGPIPGAELPGLPASVQVLIEVGDRDTVAGSGGADAFWSWLAGRRGAPQRLVVVHSTPGFAAVHAAPKLSTSPARRAFWRPLDALIAQARGTGS